MRFQCSAILRVAAISFLSMLAAANWASAQQHISDSQDGEEDADRQLIWSDEFDGKEIDRDVWKYDVGGHGWGNGQLEFDTGRPENSYIKDGNLVIEARREKYRGSEFTSARMHTQGRFAFQYGTLEARIQVPDTADGIWPAFWMLGNNFPGVVWPKCGEVDILEIGGREGILQGLQHRRINCALHFSGRDEKKTSLVAWHQADVDLDAGFHVYQLQWTPNSMRCLLDNVEYGAWDITEPEFREFHQPFFPILNVAVGSWTSSYTTIDTPEKVTATFPARMHVDWIRLYANEHTQVVSTPAPIQSDSFGVFSERPGISERLDFADGSDPDFQFGDQAALFLWNNVKATQNTEAYEGQECWRFEIRAGDWFGLGVMSPRHRNLAGYQHGHLSFAIQTRLTNPVKVGIKTSQGEVWVPLSDEKAEIGFARDGKWHQVEIPISRFDTDLNTVHQFLMLAGDAPERDATLAIDDIRWVLD